MRHLIISASPRKNGKCSCLSKKLKEKLSLAFPNDKVSLFNISKCDNLQPCNACSKCAGSGTCVIKDDMQKLYKKLDRCNYLFIVAPVYFAGPPAQFKAVIDRLQKYYLTWGNCSAKSVNNISRESKNATRLNADSALPIEFSKNQQPKRNLELFVLGDGGDPHGFEPLVTSVKSSFAVAGFKLAAVHDLIAKDKREISEFIDSF